jgi:ethanolamine utilization protein EutN
MLIARVLGEVVATQKHASHVGRKILMIQPLNLDGSDRGDAVLALDAVDAGVGDRVLLATEGYSAMTSVGRPESPIDMAVVGVIDRVDLFGDAGAGGTGLAARPADVSPGSSSPADLPMRDRRRRRAG